jgi:uncharacterized protein YndB with AHSA1/START domain
MGKKTITVEVTVNASEEKVWKYWTDPEHIIQWNNASDDWHTPNAENDVKAGGSFNYRMEAKDGSFGFDFAGVYDSVKKHESIDYTLGDGRRVQIRFTQEENATRITETFEAEDLNPPDLQKTGWQSILDNFKKHTETN